MNENDREILNTFQNRLEQVENHIIIFNSEMGDVREKVGRLIGQTSIILWLMGGTFLVVVGHLFYTVFFGG